MTGHRTIFNHVALGVCEIKLRWLPTKPQGSSLSLGHLGATTAINCGLAADELVLQIRD